MPGQVYSLESENVLSLSKGAQDKKMKQQPLNDPKLNDERISSSCTTARWQFYLILFCRLSSVFLLLMTVSCAHTPIAVIPQSGAGKSPILAQTTHGKVQGFEDETGLKVFLGIPYAKPPVGNCRFAPPEDAHKWDGVRPAIEFSLSCPQIRDEFEAASLLRQSEDCLSLNIWTPGIDDKKRPVIIFIHGGGFTNGGSSDPLYNGRHISRRGDLVYVSINYRVGALGFLFLDDYGNEFAGTGNNAIRDQLMAIKWIKNNIVNFGGDPDHMTVMGESAGSVCSLVLMGLPQAKGLFSKVIAESGALTLVRSRAQAKKCTSDFMKFAGVRDVAGLRSLTAEQIIEATERHTGSAWCQADLLYTPVIDMEVIPEDPLDAIVKGAASGITLLTGTTLDEYRYWINYSWMLKHVPLRLMLRLATDVRKKIQGHEEEVFDFYDKTFPEAGMADNTFEFATDMMFFIPHIQIAGAQSKHAKVYMYRFDWKSQAKEYLGACHVIEIPFILKTFDSPKRYQIVGLNPPLLLSDAIQDAWIAFARSGDPNIKNLPGWPSYDEKARATMIFNTESRVEQDPEKNTRLFFQGILH